MLLTGVRNRRKPRPGLFTPQELQDDRLLALRGIHVRSLSAGIIEVREVAEVRAALLTWRRWAAWYLGRSRADPNAGLAHVCSGRASNTVLPDEVSAHPILNR
jgi:hypothetical protein